MGKRILDYIISLESGSRPKGGALKIGKVISLGAEHLNDDGGLSFKNAKFIPQHFYENLNKGKVQINDILVVKDGATTGKVAFISDQLSQQDVAINEHVFLLRVDNKNVDAKYLFYFLYSNYGKQQILADFRGSTVGGISRNFINYITVPLPNLTTQQYTAKILEEANEARQQRKKANALTEQFLRSTFLHLFGDPIKNEKKWEVKSLNKLIKKNDKINYGIVQPGDDVVDGIPIVRISDFSGLSIDSSKLKRVLSSIDLKHKKSRLIGDEVLLACVGHTIGKVALANQSLNGYNIVRAIARIRCNDLLLDRYFLAYYLQTKSVQDFFIRELRTVGQPTLNIAQIEETKIILPPISLQLHFASIVADTEKLRKQQKESEQELEHLFQALLQQYFGAEKVNTTYTSEAPVLSVAAEASSSYKTINSSIPANKKGFAKYVLAGKIIKECHNKKEFTHIKFQKLQHLSEYLLEEELDQNFYYEAAGPYDNKLMNNLANKMQQQKWFSEVDYTFIPLAKAEEVNNLFDRYFQSKKDVFTRLIRLLGNATESQCEIVSTLFAIWNDMLIQKEEVSETEIVKRFYQWSDRKKKYTEEQLIKAMSWMRENQIVPHGFGTLIKHAKKQNIRL